MPFGSQYNDADIGAAASHFGCKPSCLISDFFVNLDIHLGSE